MIYKKLMCMIIPLIFIQNSGFGQEFVNLMEPQEISEEFIEYNKMLDLTFSRDSLKKEYRLKKGAECNIVVNTSNFKKIISLNFFARMFNPYLHGSEHFKCNNNKLPKELNLAIKIDIIDTYLLFNKDNYINFDFKYPKYYLYDFYEAPFVLIGTITHVDTMDLRNTRHYIAQPHILIYEMRVTDNLNNYCKIDVLNKKLRFALSPFSRTTSSEQPYWRKNADGKKNYRAALPKHLRRRPHLELNKEFLIFIIPSRTKALEDTKDENIPCLAFNMFGSGCFPIERNEIINLYHYFGNDDTISITDVKIKIQSILDEIYKWKEK